MDELGEQQLRAARTQSLYRDVNEQIRQAQARMGPGGDEYEVICECCVDGCADRLRLTPAEYELVRAGPNRFVVAPGHVNLDIEQVVERNARFEVVEKLGAGAAFAARNDPRA
jgi:hypothetical protein